MQRMGEATLVRGVGRVSERGGEGRVSCSLREDVGGFRQCCPFGREQQANAAKAWKAPEPEGQGADELLGQ